MLTLRQVRRIVGAFHDLLIDCVVGIQYLLQEQLMHRLALLKGDVADFVPDHHDVVFEADLVENVHFALAP